MTLSIAEPARPAAHRAMRYYRIWIYACNGALLLGTLAFCAAAGRALADYRRALVPGLAAAQPGFLYGYAVLPVQAGLLQLLGCMAALRLSERMLNAYWLALLALLVGDAAIGVYWAFKFERVCRELRPQLRLRLAKDYEGDIDFAESWDRLQREQRCCGVTGPADYTTLNRTTLPLSCCRVPAYSPAVTPVLIATVSTSTVAPFTPMHCSPHTVACAERLLIWLRRTADALFVLGYCVIAFLKLCFLGILRYEIKEMIQKIRILKSEIGAEELLDGSPLHGGGGPLSQTVIVNAVNVNGGVRGHRGGGSPDRAGERDALLGRVGDPCSRRGTHHEDLLAPKSINGNNNCELRELARGEYRPLAVDSAATRI